MLSDLFYVLFRKNSAGEASSVPNEQVKNTATNREVRSSDVSFNSIREFSKRQMESFEHWAKRLIHDTFKTCYGENYLDAMVSEDRPLVKNEIKKRILDRMAKEPNRYSRPIDALTLEDIKYLLTRDDLYNVHFNEAFSSFYSGVSELRSTLERLIPIRNKLYHDNAISTREAEQVLCYTNDFIETCQSYYQRQGKERAYNVPVILSLSDSQGNRSFRRNTQYLWEVRNYDKNEVIYRTMYPDEISTKHRSGECYTVELEVDSSFPTDMYRIEWSVEAGFRTILTGCGSTIEFVFTDPMVSLTPKIEVKLITNRSWHRFASQDCDDLVRIHLNEVLPPIEDTY